MNRIRHIGIITALVLGLASWAFAQRGAGKTGNLTLAAATQVGSVVLPAGNYEVRHVASPTGHFMEFVRVTEWNLGYEGTPTYTDREVVAKVNCNMQSLNAKAGKTVIEKEGSRLARLEIKGENVAHNFNF
jgi:hypothetical protein